MKKAILIFLVSSSVFATQRFEITTQVATCFVLTSKAVESGTEIVNSKAAKKCKDQDSKSTAYYDSYLEVHSMNNNNLCGGIEISRFYTCAEK